MDQGQLGIGVGRTNLAETFHADASGQQLPAYTHKSGFPRNHSRITDRWHSLYDILKDNQGAQVARLQVFNSTPESQEAAAWKTIMTTTHKGRPQILERKSTYLCT